METCFISAACFVFTVMSGQKSVFYTIKLCHFIIHWFIIFGLNLNLICCILEMFSSIIHAVGPIHFYIEQSLVMSVSCLISHLAVSDLNTTAAIYFHFLVIYHRQHYFISDIQWDLTLSIQSALSMNYCNSIYYRKCWDNNVSEMQTTL